MSCPRAESRLPAAWTAQRQHTASPAATDSCLIGAEAMRATSPDFQFQVNRA